MVRCIRGRKRICTSQIITTPQKVENRSLKMYYYLIFIQIHCLAWLYLWFINDFKISPRGRISDDLHFHHMLQTRLSYCHGKDQGGPSDHHPRRQRNQTTLLRSAGTFSWQLSKHCCLPVYDCTTSKPVLIFTHLNRNTNYSYRNIVCPADRLAFSYLSCGLEEIKR